ncbi:anti-anti-sigma factor [Amycolatopsis lexingtonensis]|uniref:Anti-anti-sigma factor n=1 Tax=Amycolatopsis lexingtonensis TaxID=218822 RepID=A0ABR9HX00_9PSEU|nr:STAS domain-containing protein [Amycolatopsis lexingtonensis]MBE1495465.1 anti-anti-sigma factor [Amycolatopsis lexingtonensis]
MPERPNVTVTVHRVDGTRVLAVAGDLDLGTVAAIRARLGEIFADGATAVVADLRDVTFCSTAGLHLIEELRCRSVACPASFGVVVGDPISGLLRFLELPDGLRIYPTLAAALAPR